MDSCSIKPKPPLLSGSNLSCPKGCMTPTRPRGLPGGAEPARLRQPACGKAASQPTAGRARLWRNFRNP